VDHNAPASQAGVVAVGMGVAFLSGALSLGGLRPDEAAAWTALLLWVFLLAYAGNRLQRWATRPPHGTAKALLTSVAGFLPLFLGWFPTDGWRTELARAHAYQGVPSIHWLLVLTLWGLLAPGSVAFERARAALAPRRKDAPPAP
jgi:hypothetical protein